MVNLIKWNLVFEFILTFLIPFLYLGNIYVSLITPNTASFPFVFNLLGIVIALIGLTAWILSYINLGKSFGVLPKKQKRVRKGIYKHFNHPMYIGIWLTFLGLSLANSSLPGIIFLVLIITPLLLIRAYFEDKKLAD